MHRQIFRYARDVHARRAARAVKTRPHVRSHLFSSPVAVQQTNLLINGVFVPSHSGKTFEMFILATKEKIAEGADAFSADIDADVEAARAAF
ncbi:unnamed protein product [Hyaloperonospora brassicae]|uniref:Aldehyde dehydrogenase domain-containing protein n=1 Tax=Hyaloperonospora brassicae TaxID=162125 RepID=A0AAV0T3V6_HYABA|nr:unnamed protein product [Hyaloperonospora brassicae]